MKTINKEDFYNKKTCTDWQNKIGVEDYEKNRLKNWAYISKDEGKTWEGPFCVTEREAKYRTTLNGLLYQAKNGTNASIRLDMNGFHSKHACEVQ